MFRKNQQQKQLYLISNINDLGEKHRKRLEQSWAGTFYKEVFCRIDEEIFRGLYSDIPSRPNIPVNILLSLEILKVGRNWSDEEMLDHYYYDLQVRYALGLHQIGEEEFDIRSVYNFRARLAAHMQKTGENLIEKAFQQVGEEQLKAYAINTEKQRMDSTQIASNIKEMGRLQLLVAVIQRMYREMKAEDQERYKEQFTPYLQGNVGQYVYRLMREERETHLERIGWFMKEMIKELEEGYGGEEIFEIMKRVYEEHYLEVAGKGVRPKRGKELSADSLQSVEDREASYREKNGRKYKGYVANIAETCDKENPIQLITQVQVEPNVKEDAEMLVEGIEELKERTGVKTLYTDGGYGSKAVDEVLKKNGVELIQTAIRGRKQSEGKKTLADFEIQENESGEKERIKCPHGYCAQINKDGKKSYVVYFEKSQCGGCPFRGQCIVKIGKREKRYKLRFTEGQAFIAQRRRRSKNRIEEGRNLRAAIEATIRQIKHPFGGGKLPVRGLFRVTNFVISSAMMVNLRRIHRYNEIKYREEQRRMRASERDSNIFDYLIVLLDNIFEKILNKGFCFA